MPLKLTLKRGKSAHTENSSLAERTLLLYALRRSVSSPCQPALGEVLTAAPDHNVPATEVSAPTEEANSTQRCLICLEDKPEIALSSCGNSNCEGVFCPSCLAGYFKEKVSTSRFALPPMTCPACRLRVRTDSWRRFVDEATFERYVQNAYDLLTLRCPDCDSMVSLWHNCFSYHFPEAMQCFFAQCEDVHAVRHAWSSFEEGQIGPDDFLDVLHRSGPSNLKDTQAELRVADNGGAYSQNQFLKWYDLPSNYATDDGWYGACRSENESRHVDLSCSGCLVCGCHSELDSLDDRVCWCDICQLTGCAFNNKRQYDGCFVCGCNSELDSFGDRVCWCDSCQLTGCIFSKEQVRYVHPTARARGACQENEDGIEGNNTPQLSGSQIWLNAAQWCPSKRRANDGWEYSLDEFEAFYGQVRGREIWEGMPIHNIKQVLVLINDVERRTALHLAFLRKSPHIVTPCCSVDYCFRCQMTWHDYQTCEEIIQSSTVKVQFCPGCYVPTQRSEGCSSMVCLCGEHWHWDGDSDSDGEF